MIADEVTQNSRAPANTRWVAGAGRVQQYSDTLEGRGGQYDRSAKDFTLLPGIPINHQDALGFAGFRVDQDLPDDAIGLDAEPSCPARERQRHRDSPGIVPHIPGRCNVSSRRACGHTPTEFLFQRRRRRWIKKLTIRQLRNPVPGATYTECALDFIVVRGEFLVRDRPSAFVGRIIAGQEPLAGDSRSMAGPGVQTASELSAADPSERFPCRSRVDVLAIIYVEVPSMRCEKGAPSLDVLIVQASAETKCAPPGPRSARLEVTLRVERATSLQENYREPAFCQLFCCPTSGGAGPYHDRVIDHHEAAPIRWTGLIVLLRDRVQIAYRTNDRRVLRNRSMPGGRKAGARRHAMTGAARGRGRNPAAMNHPARMARRFHGSLACRLATAPRSASAT